MKKKKNVVLTIVLLSLFLYFVSPLYRLLTLVGLVLVWRKELNNRYVGISKKLVIAILFLMMIMALPFNWGRTKLVYQDENYHPTHTPISHWIISALVPESEIMNAATLVCTTRIAEVIPLKPFQSFVNGILYKQYQEDFGIRHAMLKPYRKVHKPLGTPVSGIWSQCANMAGMKQTRAVFIQKPKHYDANKEYPLVVFCHGYMGNWLGYQGVFKDIDNCIILSIGTKDISGIFKYDDINKIFTKQIPFLEELGYKIDKSNVHIMGLSNGGSAVKIAYNNFSSKFASITFVSTGMLSHKVPCAVYYVGGCDTNAGGCYKQAKANGMKTACLYNPKWNHYLIMRHMNAFTEFMNASYNFKN